MQSHKNTRLCISCTGWLVSWLSFLLIPRLPSPAWGPAAGPLRISTGLSLANLQINAFLVKISRDFFNIITEFLIFLAPIRRIIQKKAIFYNTTLYRVFILRLLQTCFFIGQSGKRLNAVYNWITSNFARQSEIGPPRP